MCPLQGWRLVWCCRLLSPRRAQLCREPSPPSTLPSSSAVSRHLLTLLLCKNQYVCVFVCVCRSDLAVGRNASFPPLHQLLPTNHHPSRVHASHHGQRWVPPVRVHASILPPSLPLSLPPSPGWGLAHQNVWLGFVVTTIWFLLFLFVAGLALKLRK